MQDIDGMDMLGYLKIRAWKVGREKKKAMPQRRFIDEVWGNMTPTEA